MGCVPLFSTIDETTNIGPLVILGMPFLRQYGVLFNRTWESMSFARLTRDEGHTLCGDCCEGCSAWQNQQSAHQNAPDSNITDFLNADPEGNLTSPDGVLEHNFSTPIDAERIRWPWYLLPPSAREAYAREARDRMKGAKKRQFPAEMVPNVPLPGGGDGGNHEQLI